MPAASTTDQPTAQLSLDEAQRTAADFLNAWAVDGYDAMYNLLATNSRDEYDRTAFETYYADAEQAMTLLPGGKSYLLTNAIQQGSTADIAYDMSFKTQVFDTVTDPGRLLRLVVTPEGWRVAWSPDNVFVEMKEGAVLDLSETFPTRGNIYDRERNVIPDDHGAVIQITLLTKAYPGGNPENCFNQLARIFPTQTADRMKQIYGNRTGQDYAYVIGSLSQEIFQVERVLLESVCTLKYDSIPTRRYVAGGLAPNIVGYIGRIPAETADEWIRKGYPADALIGIDGIERYHESTLAGKGAAILALWKNGSKLRTLAERKAQPAQSIYLSLDRKLQEATQEMLKDAYANSVWGGWSTGAAAVVMDIHTGEILTIASYPDFNVDAFNPHTELKDAQALIDSWYKDPRKPTYNRATLGMYPPGSVFKIVTMAAAADSGEFTTKKTFYNCTGTWNGAQMGDVLRRDWIYHTDQGAHGRINLEQALMGSCDTYFWHVGQTLNQVDPNILIKYSRQMGFGAPTGIQDVGEASGALPDPANYEQVVGRKWRLGDALNMSIGQGDVQVTPLQIVRMVAAIANGGTLYQPLLVEKIGIINEPSYIAKPIPNGNLKLSPEVLAGIQEAMCGVTTNVTIGTAEFVFRDFKGAVICGKTGTAEVGGPNDAPHAWFAAYAGKSADKPDIAIVVVVEHSHEGSFVAAPIVKRIVENYYDLEITPWPSWYQGLPTLHGE
jgi:penicillin-binding protein 2